MSTTTITGLFPRFDNGDVKIILSDKPADTLLLHTSVLTKESSFFKASLENVGWAQNKYVWVVDGKKMSHPIKVLKLDFDGDDTFPLLLGTTIDSSKEQLVAKLATHDEATKHEQSGLPYDCGDSIPNLTLKIYHTSQIVEAYKIGLALLYGLRIDWPASDEEVMRKAASVIPAVVDFADAYGLLPALNDRINALIFGHAWSGFDLIGTAPFQVLR